MSSADLPFKCHLCEGSYAERQEALDHIRESHPSEFELLMSKGALDSSSSTGIEDNNNVSSNMTQHPDDGNAGGEESLEHLRGKFPDYANRKVMCAFCMRRFWSAEDLRRHMRTHTGERPFSCDICRRRFTLKHSMLRHRKKHSATSTLYSSSTTSTEDVSVVSGDEDHPSSGGTLHNMLHHHTKKHHSGGEDVTGVSGDEEVGTSLSGSIDGKPLKMKNHNNNNITTASAAKGINHWDNDSETFTASAAAKILSSKFSLCTSGSGDRRDETDDDNTDLIGNLLGIQGSIIDKVLQSKLAADEAARLLGVQNGANQE
ncbi:hypothetical protein B7P43_G07506 [Cryptotermes secundus]|uniref:C2H2-type domain-containing protein n=3 Tax=Cryptotermes secundus TaxID=105785 RepID=A0A2J7PSI7_9NEOP|nr:hypothetical protein B7P43_G07506 [Cryptotermes secundus]